MKARRAAQHIAFLVPSLAALLAVAPGSAAAGDRGLALRARAAQLAAEQGCAQALPVLEQARTLSPDDPQAALLQGQCLLDQKRYAEAAAALDDASRLDPASAPAAKLLGIARYHAGDSAAAEAALARAEQLAPDDAQVALYQGLVLLDLARSDEATERFRRASMIDPATTEPMASYYAGLALSGAGRSEEAEAALRRASELAPGSEWDRQAQAALSMAHEGGYALRRWLILRAGVAYDSNVSLRGNDVDSRYVSNRDDGRAEWAVEAGAELFRNGDWGGGVLGDYYGNKYFQDSDFDQAYVSVGFWIDRKLGEHSLVRVQPVFGASFYDYDDFLRFYGVQAELFHDWGSAGTGTFRARYAYDDYLYNIIGSGSLADRRDHDGHEIGVGYDHRLPLGDTTVLEGGPFFRYYAAEGSEWDHWAAGAWLGVEQQLPCDFLAEVSGSYAHAGYRRTSTFLLPGESAGHRNDDIGAVQVVLERPLTDRVTASARWTYLNNSSNTRVFDYERHIAGLYVTVAFGSH